MGGRGPVRRCVGHAWFSACRPGHSGTPGVDLSSQTTTGTQPRRSLASGYTKMNYYFNFRADKLKTTHVPHPNIPSLR